MVLETISIGYAVPHTDFDATVHSVFRSAINLRPSSGGELLTLVAFSEADLPQGIRVDTPSDFSFEIFNTGEQATCRENILRLNSLIVDLRDAQRWKCDLPALQADLGNPTVTAAWKFVWQALNQRQIQSNAEIIAENLFHSDESMRGIQRIAGDAIRGLVNATQCHDLILATSSVHALIGLGTGLTPGGDDLLVGYLAGLWCAVHDSSERRQFVSELGNAIIHHSQQTNDISRVYLYHASQGQVSSLLAKLADAICMGKNAGHLIDTAETAMRVGHTSGMDAVTGLLVGLTAWVDSDNQKSNWADSLSGFCI
jgi:hypothetical protein